MTGARGLTLVACLALGTWVSAQRNQPIASVDLVELDISVIDKQGHPVRGLSQGDFVIKEDGKPVEITTFTEVSPDRSDPDQSRRTVVMLLDDIAIPPAGSRAIQAVATALLNSIPSRDEVAVVRLHNTGDEPFGDRRLAEARIAEYRAGARPYSEGLSIEQAFERFGNIARQLESLEGRRKVIVCIGSPVMCNPAEPTRIAPRKIWPNWVELLAASAKANVSVFTIVPARINLRGGGVPDFTGGEVFSTNYDVGPAIDRILQHANNYYMAGYWPGEGKPRELHSIRVQVKTRGAKVIARRQRGA